MATRIQIAGRFFVSKCPPPPIDFPLNALPPPPTERALPMSVAIG